MVVPLKMAAEVNALCSAFTNSKYRTKLRELIIDPDIKKFYKTETKTVLLKSWAGMFKAGLR